MSFRELFFRLCSALRLRKPLPFAVVSDTEPLTRYVFSRSELSGAKPKPSAFLPNPRNGKTSIFRTLGLIADQIWQIGNKVVGSKRGKTAVAYASFSASIALQFKLTVKPEISLHRRHADLDNWPTEKERQKEIANEFRAKCHSVVASQ
jgi:hypothetical protein